LEDSGFPLLSDRDGRQARWKMMEGYRHRLQLSLTWSELLGLLVASQLLGGLEGTVFFDGTSSALEKIRATLPKAMADRFRASTRVASAARGGTDYTGRTEITRRLLEAVDGRKTVVLTYRTPGKSSKPRRDRQVDPYHFHVGRQAIYLLGWCHRSQVVKTFRLDRVDEVALTEKVFPEPVFDAATFLRPMFGMWAGRTRRISFVVGKELAPLLMERKVHASQVVQRVGDGSAEVRLDATIGPPLVAYLTSLGASVTRIEPEELRSEVEKAHREALRSVTRGDAERM
jgi:predicted DNA-binding transcriptional regulator YafY